MLPPEQRTDIPRLQVHAGDTLTFQLGFRPTAASLALVTPDHRQLLGVPLPETETIRWRVPADLDTPNREMLAMLALGATNGDATYLVWVHE